MSSGIYRIYGEDACLLYIGQSINMFQRIAQHQTDKDWWPKVTDIKFEYVQPKDLDTAERAAIRAENPLYNKIRFSAGSKKKVTKADKSRALDALFNEATKQRRLAFQFIAQGRGKDSIFYVTLEGVATGKPIAHAGLDGNWIRSEWREFHSFLLHNYDDGSETYQRALRLHNAEFAIKHALGHCKKYDLIEVEEAV